MYRIAAEQSAHGHVMSALPPKADISQRSDFMSCQTSIISFVLPPCR